MVINLPVTLPDEFHERFSLATAAGQPVDFSADFHFTPAEMLALIGLEQQRRSGMEQFVAEVNARAQQATDQIAADANQAVEQKAAEWKAWAAATVEATRAEAQKHIDQLRAENSHLSEMLTAAQARETFKADAPTNITVSVPAGSIKLLMPDTVTETTVEQDKHTGRIAKTRAVTRAVAA